MEPSPRHRAYADVSISPEKAHIVETNSTACIHCNIRGVHVVIPDAPQDIEITEVAIAVLGVRLKILNFSWKDI